MSRPHCLGGLCDGEGAPCICPCEVCHAARRDAATAPELPVDAEAETEPAGMTMTILEEGTVAVDAETDGESAGVTVKIAF